MKTDDLIEMLSANLEPVKRGDLRRTLALTVAAGGLAAIVLMLVTVGIRPDGSWLSGYLFLKLLFMAILIGCGWMLLGKLMRPGQDGRIQYVLIAGAFVAIVAAGICALAFQPSAARNGMVMGTEWGTCALCIPLFAILPFTGLIWALRRGAPTKLRRTGAIAGLVAGALGAVAYAFHCPDDSLPFIALWYGAMVGLCSLVGGLLGPRLLRW